MSISVFPEPSAASAGPSAFSVTVATAHNPQKIVKSVDAGVYTITVSPSSSTALVTFASGNTFIGSTQTSSGSITYNLATPATVVYAQSNNANDVITINLTASSPVNTALSGTLDTLTTSGTYNQTGLMWILAIGGGGGGGGAKNGSWFGGGGGAGGLSMFYGNVSTPTVFTIGTAGTGGAINNNGNNGGTTSFGSYAVATGGNGGSSGNTGSDTGVAGGTGTTGTAFATGGSGGGNYIGTKIGQATINIWRMIKNGTYGGGGGGTSGGVGGDTSGAGDGVIGRGGNGGYNGSVSLPTAGTGFGSGGGGGGAGNGGSDPSAGANGAPGVIYVLRGF